MNVKRRLPRGKKPGPHWWRTRNLTSAQPSLPLINARGARVAQLKGCLIKYYTILRACFLHVSYLGGWLLVANFWLGSATPPSVWTAETAYSGIRNYQNNQMGITTSAMTQLRAHLNFSQMRFHCSKEQGRTFHVITAANSTGEAVVQYFSGQTDTLPASCGSFVTMEDDNSKLARKCSKWGNDGSHYVGKWGHYHKQGGFRMYDHAAFVAHLHHWIIFDTVGKCDEGADVTFSKGDFWKIFVR